MKWFHRRAHPLTAPSAPAAPGDFASAVNPPDGAPADVKEERPVATPSVLEGAELDGAARVGSHPVGEPASVWSSRSGKALVAALLGIVITIAALAVGSVLIRLQLIVIPVLIALLLASAISPFVDFLRRHNVPTLLAVWIALLAGIAGIGGLATAVIHSITSQWGQIAFNSDVGFDRLERQLASTALPFTEQELRQAREAAVQSFFSGFSVGDALGALSVFANAFTAVLLTIVVLFFFLKDGRTMWIFLTRPLMGRPLHRTQHAGEQAILTMGRYLRGTTIIALIDAAGIGIAMFVLGIPFALPLIMIIFLGGFIPVVGATVTGIFAVLVAYVTSGTSSAIVLAIAVVIVQQAEGNLLQPLIMGKAVKLHPVVILLALGAGAILAGVIGAVLAVPACAVVWAAVKAWNEKPGQGAHAAPHP